MSVLDHRLQVLLDAERLARLEAESRATGRSMGAIVRGAIDLHYARDDESAVRMEAARRLLERAATRTSGREPDWAEAKASFEQEMLDEAELLGF